MCVCGTVGQHRVISSPLCPPIRACYLAIHHQKPKGKARTVSEGVSVVAPATSYSYPWMPQQITGDTENNSIHSNNTCRGLQVLPPLHSNLADVIKQCFIIIILRAVTYSSRRSE